MSLFHTQVPLAERLRPTRLEDIIGQEHLIGPGSVLRGLVLTGHVPSMILWGPPGVGKTTLAQTIASYAKQPFYSLSAISAGVKDVREIIDKARKSGSCILFIDEIHRFNKSQQDALLNAVEKGWITLIGATTENPSFEVNSALLSRCQVYILRTLEQKHLLDLIDKALQQDEVLAPKKIQVAETEALIRISGGDARKLLNLLEIVAENLPPDTPVTDKAVMDIAQQKIVLYDKSGEQHYDIISAFIKSIRGSDPNAAVYWLARMLEGGEDIKFIARRMIILASEDIGNANSNALLMATTTFQAVSMIGMPEARIILSQCAVYLACSAKSNASYLAIDKAIATVRQQGDLPVPLHLRNAPTQLMKNTGYGKDYKYAHDFPFNFVKQDYLPEELLHHVFYEPGANPREDEFRKRLKALWNEYYGY